MMICSTVDWVLGLLLFVFMAELIIGIGALIFCGISELYDDYKRWRE
jgi:ABC-type polysaccharide/polyol phosphate export permease